MMHVPLFGMIPWKKKWQPTPVFLPEEFYGQRNLAGDSPWGCKELDMTEYTHTRILNPDTLDSKVYTYNHFASLHLIRV